MESISEFKNIMVDDILPIRYQLSGQFQNHGGRDVVMLIEFKDKGDVYYCGND